MISNREFNQFTKLYKGDKKIALIDKYSKKELEQIVKESFSIKEVIDKLGYSTHSGSNNKTVKNRIKKYNIDISHFNYKKGIERNKENVFIKNSSASQATLRSWYLKGNYTPYICSICKLNPFWQGKPLTLILDHINGENHDDRLENLRWVCPNCNQQLPTTNGKNIKRHFMKNKKNNGNKKSNKCFCKNCGKEISSVTKSKLCCVCSAKKRRICDRPSRDELKFLIRNYSFISLGEKFGVSDKAITKWCTQENLPNKKKLINSFSDEEWESL